MMVAICLTFHALMIDSVLFCVISCIHIRKWNLMATELGRIALKIDSYIYSFNFFTVALSNKNYKKRKMINMENWRYVRISDITENH